MRPICLAKFLFVIVACLAAAACKSLAIDLEPAGERVGMLRTLSASQQLLFEKMKYISCDTGANGRSGASNDLSCENFLRNEAGRMGADFVLVEVQKEGESWSFGKSCNNCVLVAGWSYRKKPVAEREPAAETPTVIESPESAESFSAPLNSRVKNPRADGKYEPFQLDPLRSVKPQKR